MSIFSLCSDNLKQSGINKNAFTKVGMGEDNTAYGKIWMDSNSKRIYSWNIKLDKQSSSIYIGIVSNFHHQTAQDFSANHSYCVGMTGGFFGIDGSIITPDNAPPSCKQGDTFTFIVNLQQMQLECIKNNKVNDKKIICQNVKKGSNLKYRLALSIYRDKDTVTVTSNDNNDDETKDDDDQGVVVRLVQKISILEEDNKKKTSQIDKYFQQNDALRDINNKSIEHIKKLENDNKQKTSQIDKFSQQMDELRATNALLQKEKQSLTDINNQSVQRITKLENDNKQQQNKISSLEIENNSDRERIESLENERKEFEMTINELTQENKQLKLQNLNTDNYEDWSADEIVHWFISLDPQIYGNYEQILRNTMKEEEVSGDDLNEVDIHDIKRWGIKNFKHSKKLLKEIKAMIEDKNKNKNKSKNNQNNQMLNEGANPPTAYI